MLWLTVPLTEVATSQDVPGFVSNALLMPFINEVNTLSPSWRILQMLKWRAGDHVLREGNKTTRTIVQPIHRPTLGRCNS